jgi:hypothetical protein
MASSIAELANEAIKKEIDLLREEMVRLTDLVAGMAKSGSDRATEHVQGAVERVMDRTSGVVDGVVSQAKEKASEVKDAALASGQDAAGELGRRVEPIAADLSDRIRRNPGLALLVAIGLGLVVGAVLRRTDD